MAPLIWLGRLIVVFSLMTACCERAWAVEGPAEHAAEHAADPFATDPISWDADLALWTFVMFLVLLAVLSKFAWKPIAQALEERERAIESNIAKAEGAAAEARGMLSEYEKK